ncbi:hypothetical protein M433DRAFT_153011 [Acidomyces richmondensis BFW]|nr:MAG: hypothetical protein FE78DRAFT_88651 [Acidomyces sp. 'richmondensis']KYG46763.1 hypothetical protein M433DRAFT_153011 [Acidomyces richmondensis BFW]
MSSNSVINSDTAAKLLSPASFCHLVLKTTPDNYHKMIAWYRTFLGAHLTHQNARITFMTYDEEHHRLAILQNPQLTHTSAKTSVGLAHMAFGFEKLSDLATSYEQKKAHNIFPVWCVNHGMSTSMYYEDPDGNEVEVQVDNFDSKEEGMRFIEGASFAENPVGVDFDPEVFVKRVRSGEDQKAIKKRPDIGKRMTRLDKAGVFG